LAHLEDVNRYRLYVIYGNTHGGIERKWGRYAYGCALDVWNNYYRVNIELVERSWLYGLTDEMERERRRLAALRILAFAYEAQGDMSAATRESSFCFMF
jgi:hypothetical protein